MYDVCSTLSDIIIIYANARYFHIINRLYKYVLIARFVCVCVYISGDLNFQTIYNYNKIIVSHILLYLPIIQYIYIII